MGKYYIYRMDILENDSYYGSYIGQHKMGAKNPSCDGYRGSGSKWVECILKNHIPVSKTILKVCDNIEESNYWERYYIEQAEQAGTFLWNIMRGGGNHERDRIYTDDEIKAHDKARFQRWYEANKERQTEYRRKYYEHNKERVNAHKKQYEEEHREHFVEYHRRYYRENKDAASVKRKQYWQENKERFREQRKEYQKQYKETHAEYEQERNRQYYQNHKDERNQYYNRLCSYDGETLTFRALILRFNRRKVANPTETARQYLI